jgi:hypothetical protein
MMKSIARRMLLFSVVILVVVNTLSGQLIYTLDFTRALAKAGIEYAEATEQWLHVVFPPYHVFMDYDLVLQNDRNDYEIRYHIRTLDEGIPPTVAVSRLVASIASNAEIYDIHVKVLTEEFLKNAFNAERGVIAYFKPKEEFSEKPFGALLSLYTHDKPAIDVILLYRNPTYDPLKEYRGVRFISVPEAN